MNRKAPLSKTARAVLDVLSRPQSEPLKRADLAFAILVSERDVRRAVSELVAKGHPIVSSGSGFFVATNADALYEAAEGIDLTVRALNKKKKAYLRAALRMEERAIGFKQE